MATPEYAPDVAAPAGPGAPAPWRPEIQREPAPAAVRPLSTRKAVALLAAMALTGVLLIGVMVRIAARGLAATTAAPVVPAGRLILPAPALAGGLPRRYRPLVNPLDVAEMTQFRQRFIAAFGAAAGSYAAGLYVQPGRIDLATDTAGWITYLGVNSRATLGGPAAAVARLIASLAGPSARTWPVPAGPGGGSARCGITVLGGAQASVCAWATGEVAAALMSPARDTSAAQLEVFLPGMRASLQSGSS